MRVLLIRHAQAGNRSTWDGDDLLRPLDKRGRRQAAALPGLLAEYPVDRLLGEGIGVGTRAREAGEFRRERYFPPAA